MSEELNELFEIHIQMPGFRQERIGSFREEFQTLGAF